VWAANTTDSTSSATISFSGNSSVGNFCGVEWPEEEEEYDYEAEPIPKQYRVFTPQLMAREVLPRARSPPEDVVA
jgi:hypothetical protein